MAPTTRHAMVARVKDGPYGGCHGCDPKAARTALRHPETLRLCAVCEVEWRRRVAWTRDPLPAPELVARAQSAAPKLARVLRGW
jgi:hypothetical protein